MKGWKDPQTKKRSVVRSILLRVYFHKNQGLPGIQKKRKLKNLFRGSISFCFFLLPFLLLSQPASWIRTNQLGYLPHSVKVAVFISLEEEQPETFVLMDKETGNEVFQGTPKPARASAWGMKSASRLDFSKFEQSGTYYLKAGSTTSLEIDIHTDVYSGTADFLLNYMRQQRCRFNPYLNDSCHLHDGIIVDHPTRSGMFIDVTGGWHDATDYLQYTTTSANALYQMMFAYRRYPEAWGDAFQANGLPGKNGIRDILDEIMWGLEWLLKMNPSYGEMYNQIADDRDHIGFRLPTLDTADYGLGNYRPVYFVTGNPQGLADFKNQSTGVSSIAGKFASCFASAAILVSDSDPGLSSLLQKKATEAYQFGKTKPGYSQTACNVSPYFYEEENYADDMELAASQLFQLTGKKRYLKEAIRWSKQEPVTPWMKEGKARHYQYYPFVNLGHYLLAQHTSEKVQKRGMSYYRRGLQSILERGKEDPFLNGVPFIWCSNNLVVATLTQARLYAELTGNDEFVEMEASMRDWLFGCNPWGTSMICGLPGVKDSPMKPHSSYTVLLGETTYGGLVDGPVYDSIFQSHIGITLTGTDPYAPFQQGKAVYHDDVGDYTSNEPTMDGTASLCFYLASLESNGKKQKEKTNKTHAED
jgi:endoglucanase